MNKQKIILFDGPDKVGKSSIAKELSKVLDIPYFKFTKHDYWARKEYELATKFDQPFLAELLRMTGYSLIIDRGYPSEYAYAPVFDRELDEKLILDLDDMFSDFFNWFFEDNKFFADVGVVLRFHCFHDFFGVNFRK